MRRVRAKLMAMNMNYQKESDDEEDRKTQQKQAATEGPKVPAPTETFTAPKRSKWEKAVIPTAIQAKV